MRERDTEKEEVIFIEGEEGRYSVCVCTDHTDILMDKFIEFMSVNLLI